MSRNASRDLEEENNKNDDGLNIDFGKYIETLVRQWQWIVLCALVLGLLAIISVPVLNHLYPTYRAVALVASTATSSNVNFSSTTTSSSDNQSAEALGNIHYDWGPTRLQSFVSQVQNGAIAEQVISELGPLRDKKGNIITAAELLNLVKGDLIKNTDTIRITVTYSDPTIAAEVANAWSDAFVQRINEIYSSSGTTSRATDADVSQSKAAYDKAEADLEDFIAHDKTAEYQRQIDDYSSIIPVGRQLGLFLDSAISMRAAVNAGGESAAKSNALALTMLKTQIYAAYQGTNTLQVQNLPEALGSSIANVNASGMVADLDALISTLKTYQNEIEVKTIENEQRIRELNSLIASQTSMLTVLTGTRDLAWKSYSALATKAIEMSVNAQNTQVILAASAATPQNSGRSVKNTAILAAIAGFLIGIIIAYAYEFWQNYEGRQPDKIVKRLFINVAGIFHRKSTQLEKYDL